MIISDHAVERFVQRVAPWMKFSEARQFLEVFAETAAPQREKAPAGGEVWILDEPYSCRLVVWPAAEGGKVAVTVLPPVYELRPEGPLATALAELEKEGELAALRGAACDFTEFCGACPGGPEEGALQAESRARGYFLSADRPCEVCGRKSARAASDRRARLVEWAAWERRFVRLQERIAKGARGWLAGEEARAVDGRYPECLWPWLPLLQRKKAGSELYLALDGPGVFARLSVGVEYQKPGEGERPCDRDFRRFADGELVAEALKLARDAVAAYRRLWPKACGRSPKIFEAEGAAAFYPETAAPAVQFRDLLAHGAWRSFRALSAAQTEEVVAQRKTEAAVLRERARAARDAKWIGPVRYGASYVLRKDGSRSSPDKFGLIEVAEGDLVGGRAYETVRNGWIGGATGAGWWKMICHGSPENPAAWVQVSLDSELRAPRAPAEERT